MVGSFRQDTMSGERLFAVLDGKKLNLKVEEHELPLSLMQQKGTLTKQYYVWVRLPDNWQQGSKLRIVQSDEKDKKLVKTISVSQLKTKCAELACKVENVQMPNVFELTYEEQVLKIRLSGGKHNLISLLKYLGDHNISFGRVFSELPTLNDVFLEITGKELRD